MDEQAGAAPLEEQQASAVLEQQREDASNLREDGMMETTGMSVSQLEETRDASAVSPYAARLGESLSKSKYDSLAAENDSTLLKP